MRLDNGAAVIRFKFSSSDAYETACRELLEEGYVGVRQNIIWSCTGSAAWNIIMACCRI